MKRNHKGLPAIQHVTMPVPKNASQFFSLALSNSFDTIGGPR